MKKKDVKINLQFAALHSPWESEINWVEIQLVTGDICLLYHQLADYNHIMPDLYYGNVFNKEYWNYLSMDDLEYDQRLFIRSGCLVMILAMITAEVEDISAPLSGDKRRYRDCRDSVFAIEPEDDDDERLIAAVRSGFLLYEADGCGVARIYDDSPWVHEQYVRSYFRHMSQSF